MYILGIVHLDYIVPPWFQILRFQWSVKVWKNWLWQLQKMMAPLRLTFPLTTQNLLLLLWIAWQKFLAGQFSFMPQGRTRSPKFWRAKSKIATSSPRLLVSWHHAPKTQSVRVGTRWVHRKPLIFHCLQSGVWHQLATMCLSFPSLEYLDHVFKWHVVTWVIINMCEEQ